MSADPRRLRWGEIIAGLGALVMLVALVALEWQESSAGAPARTGWQCVPVLRWLLLVAIAVGLSLVLAQVLCRAPAVPASLSVVSTVIAFVAFVALIIRVVLSPPAGEQAGAWIELVGCVLLLVGSYRSLREEGIPERDAPPSIPVIDLSARPGG